MKLLRGKQIEQAQYEDYTMSNILFSQFNEYHRNRVDTPDKEIESAFYTEILDNILNPPAKPEIPSSTVIFNPSGASKCKRELYYRATVDTKDVAPKEPYHDRWTRNATLVHEGVQKDLLYMQKYTDYPLKLAYLENGRPAWEDNIKRTELLEVDGVQFGITGMMDGVFKHVPTGDIIGFEFKTKSNSVAQVGNYKMKEPAPYHIEQCVAYSLLFGISKFIIMYEAVAKDQWHKGEDARTDIRTFDVEVTPAMAYDLEQKFVEVVRAVQTGKKPDKELDKCMFCSYKEECNV